MIMPQALVLWATITSIFGLSYEVDFFDFCLKSTYFFRLLNLTSSN